MKDRVPVYPGRVKLVPVSGQENVYDMTRADQPTQQGDPLNKATLLKDATAALFGLGTDAVPDDVLALLGRLNSGLGNEYLWEKGSPFASDTIDLKNVDIADPNLGEPIKIAERVSISDDGVISLVNPTEQRMDGAFRDAVIKKPSILHGKYIQLQPSLYSTYKGVICRVTDTAYFYANGRFLAPYEKSVYTVGINTSLVGYVNSPDSEKYPPDQPDGYVYTKLGQIGMSARLNTGSYVGTGKYGNGNPNSLTFNGKPVIVLVYPVFEVDGSSSADGASGLYPGDYGYWKSSFIWTNGVTMMRIGGDSWEYNVYFHQTRKSLSWYLGPTGSNVSSQLNISGQKYGYTALLI